MKFSPDSKFFVFCSRLTELVTLNLLWLICCLPLFTIGASTTALLSSLYAWRKQEPCGAKVFFSHFRHNFGKATALWLAMVAFGILLTLDYVLVSNMDFPGRMAVIGLIFFMGFCLVFLGGMIFPLLSQFPGTIRDMVINAVLLSLAQLPKMLLVTAANLLPMVMVILMPKIFVMTGFVWLLCGFALLALYDIRVLERIFAPFQEQETA